MTYSLLEEMKRNTFIEQLKKLNITENIHDMPYSELRYTLTMARIKNNDDVNLESSENEWY